MDEMMKILVVDDNKELAVNLQDILKVNGYDVSIAYNGRSAIELCRGEQFDLGILDYKLPDMNGLQLQEELSEMTDADYIIITAHASLEIAAWAVQQRQIVGYETKPLDFKHLLAFVRQIGERRRTEQELRQKTAILKAVFQTIPAHISVTDKEFNLLDAKWEPETLANLGFKDKSEVIGLKCYEIFKQYKSVCPECIIARCMESGKPEMRLSTPMEDKLLGVPTKLYAAPVRDKQDNIIGAVECAMDITDLREMETELLRAKEDAEAASLVKTQFLANMSHEIRTPMNVIVGSSHLIMETNPTREQKEYANMIFQSSEALLALIDDILEFSKIEAERIELESADFDLKDLVIKTADMLKVKASEKGLPLTFHIPNDIPRFLKGDPNRLGQIILNLVQNAIKFTEKGKITINLDLEKEEENQVTLGFSVTDTGIGIPEEYVGSMFSPFSQADTSSTRKYGGTGLGLAISKKFVEMMGGEINFESEPGTGTTFRFTACFEKAEESADKADDERKAAPPVSDDSRFTGLHILVAEDNFLNQQLLVLLMEKMGIHVDVTDNGNGAIDALKKGGYDMIIMDIQMPGMDGFETTRIIRSSEVGEVDPDVPIIAMTANATTQDCEKCMAAGMNDYISKPVHVERLKEAIARQCPK